MLFKETLNVKAAEIKQYLSVNVSVNYNTIKPHIESCERDYIKPLLGVDQYDELVEYYEAAVGGESHLDELLELVQRALIHLSFWRGFYQFMIKVGDQGAYRTESENQKTPFKYQEVELRNSYKLDGFNALDEVLAYLEETISLFPLFEASDNYTLFKGGFINTTADFDTFYDIGGSRLVFLKLKKHLTQCDDFDILPLIGRTYFNELKAQILADTLTVANLSAVELIQKAVAPLAVARGIQNLGINITDKGLFFETRDGAVNDLAKDSAVAGSALDSVKISARDTGDAYLAYLKDHLHNNIDDYPTYEAADEYDDTNTANIRSNTDKKTFWA